MKIVNKIAALGAASLMVATGFIGTAYAVESAPAVDGVSQSNAIPSGTTPSGVTPSGTTPSNTLGWGGGFAWGEGFSLSVNKTTVMRGEKIVFTIGKGSEFSAEGTFTVEVHSKVYSLGKYTKMKNKDVNIEWTVPADMELGTHKVILPESYGNLVATFEVVGASYGKKALPDTGVADITALIAALGGVGVAGVALRRRVM